MSEHCESLIKLFEICPDAQSMNIANISAHIISFISALCVLITYCIIPNLKKNLLQRFVAYLNISNFLWNIGSILIIIGKYYDFNCDLIQIFSLIGIFGWSTANIWSFLFSLNIYWMLKGNQNLKKYEIYALIFNYVIMLLVTIAYTYVISNTQNYFFLVDLVGGLFLILAMIATIFIYKKVVQASKIIFDLENSKRALINIMRYPIVTIIMIIMYIIERILFVMEGCSIILTVIFTFRCLQGFIDAIIYGFNSSVRDEIRFYFSKRYDNNLSNSRTGQRTSMLVEVLN